MGKPGTGARLPDAAGSRGLRRLHTLHQVATAGALLLLVGQIIWLYNMVSSWFEGKRVEGGDPWNLSQDNVRTIEWQWFEQKLDTQLATDGGDEEVATDGGEPADDSDDE